MTNERFDYFLEDMEINATEDYRGLDEYEAEELNDVLNFFDCLTEDGGKWEACVIYAYGRFYLDAFCDDEYYEGLFTWEERRRSCKPRDVVWASPIL